MTTTKTRRRSPKEGSLAEYKPGVWYLRVRVPGEDKQRRKTFRGTKTEARAALREFIAEVRPGEKVDVRMTVSTLCDLWLESRKHRVAARTYERYKSIVELHIVGSFGNIRARELTAIRIERELAVWAQGSHRKATEVKPGETRKAGPKPGPLSPRSVKHVFDTLRAVYRWGVRMRLVSEDPVASVDAPTVQRQEMRTLDVSATAALLRAAAGTDLAAPIAVAVGSGLRRGELIGLRWGDIDFEVGRLTVRRSVEVVKTANGYTPREKIDEN